MVPIHLGHSIGITAKHVIKPGTMKERAVLKTILVILTLGAYLISELKLKVVKAYQIV